MEYAKWTGEREQTRKQTYKQTVEKRSNAREGQQYVTTEKSGWERFLEKCAELFGENSMLGEMLRRIRKQRTVQLVLLLCGVLLIAGATKWITDRIFYREVDITEVFAATESGCVENRVQITADYGTGFLTEHDKQSLLAYLANALGVQMEEAAVVAENDVSQIYTYTKQAKRAETIFKVITLKEDTQRTYLYAELNIYEDSSYDILDYRDRILKAFKELEVLRVETTLQFLGAYEGQLVMSEWECISNSMIKKLDGKIVYENRDPDLYTVYAYSALLPEYITSNGKQVNIQVAMRYEEDNDRTVVYLATPIIREDW